VAQARDKGYPSLDEKEPHLLDYLNVLSARRWILITTFFVVVIATLAFVLLRTPIYRPVCTLLLEPTRARVTDIKQVYDPTFGAERGGRLLRREFLETQYNLILSRPILEATFHEMGFDKMPGFRDAKDPVRAFRELFAVNGIKNSYLANVSFEWKDPELATRTLDFLVNEYIRSSRERAVGVTAEGLQSLRVKAEELRPKLEAKSRELQRFMARHNMVSLEERQNIIVERLKELNMGLTRAETRRIEAESRYRNIRDALAANRSPDEMPEVMDSDTVRDLKLEYVRTKLLCSDLSDRLGPNHPEVKAGLATLRTIRERLDSEVKSVLASAEAEYLRAKRQEEQLRSALKSQEKAVMEFNRLAAEYRIIKKDHGLMDRDYSRVTQRIGEIEIALASGPKEENVYVVAPPKVPTEPVKPRKRRALALALLLGLLLGIGLCFFVEYLDTSIKTKEEAEALLSTSVIGYVPAVSDGQASLLSDGRPLDLLALEKPLSALAEAFRSIRTALSFTRIGEESHQFVVTSALPAEGKTLVSVNIALALARAGKNVVLVDADFRRPRTHKVFGVGQSPGLSNLLAGEEVRTIDDAIRPAGNENLSLITSGPLPPNPSELLASPRMAEIVGQLADRFEYVVYDTPPAVNVTDAAVLAQQVHGAVMVLRSFSTDRAAAARARELIDGGGARLLGVILNGVDAPDRGYPYYGYRYYSKYYYYGDEEKKRARSPKQGGGSTS